MKTLTLFACLAAAALFGVGCGGGGESGGTTTGVTEEAAGVKESPKAKELPEVKEPAEIIEAAAVRPAGARIKVVDSPFGRVIADRHGEALYLFDRERRGASECYGACARAWPPLLTEGRPVAAAGTKGSLLGTTRRRNGSIQVTYAGHPLYYYVADSPGTILCHDVEEFGGVWLVVEPDGDPAPA